MSLFSRKTIDDIKDLNTKRLQLAARIDHDQRLKPNDKLLARTLLQTHFNPKMNGQCNPSHRTLSITTGGLSKSSIKRSSRQLKARGVFTTYQPGRTTQQYESCEYTFNWNWVGSCEWKKCKNCITTRERNAAMGVSLPPMPEKIMGVRKCRHGGQKNTAWGSDQANHGGQGCATNNVIETTQATTQKTTHAGVCDSASPSQMNEGTSISPKDDSTLHKNSTRPSDSYIDPSNPLGASASGMLRPDSSLDERDSQYDHLFASLAEEDDIPSPQANISSSYTKGDESSLQENTNPPPSQKNNFVPGISVPRGQMGWITSKNERPLRDWLVSMGLSQHSVDEIRWKTMVACFNDQTDATINSLKQHHEIPGRLNNAPAAICGDYNTPPSGSYPKDLELIDYGFNFWQTLMSGQAIVTVPKGSGSSGKDYKAYCVTVVASSEEIGCFCGLTLRDAEATIPHIAALQPTRAELVMAYYRLSDRGASFPMRSDEVVLDCIRQMQKETKEMMDKEIPQSEEG